MTLDKPKDNMEPVEQELNEIRADLDSQRKHLNDISKQNNEIYQAIIGTKLFPSTGMAHQMKVMQDNITFIIKEQGRLEKSIDDRFLKYDLERAKNITSFNLIQKLIYGGLGAILLFILEQALHLIFKK